MVVAINLPSCVVFALFFVYLRVSDTSELFAGFFDHCYANRLLYIVCSASNYPLLQ